jgi:hypothetical protein
LLVAVCLLKRSDTRRDLTTYDEVRGGRAGGNVGAYCIALISWDRGVAGTEAQLGQGRSWDRGAAGTGAQLGQGRSWDSTFVMPLPSMHVHNAVLSAVLRPIPSPPPSAQSSTTLLSLGVALFALVDESD